jgi:hypothetical protein
VHRALTEDRLGELRAALEHVAAANRRRNDILTAFLVLAGMALVLFAFAVF